MGCAPNISKRYPELVSQTECVQAKLTATGDDDHIPFHDQNTPHQYSGIPFKNFF